MRNGILDARRKSEQLRRQIMQQQADGTLDLEAIVKVAIDLTKQLELTIEAICEIDRIPSHRYYDFSGRTDNAVSHGQVDRPITNLAYRLNVPRLSNERAHAETPPPVAS